MSVTFWIKYFIKCLLGLGPRDHITVSALVHVNEHLQSWSASHVRVSFFGQVNAEATTTFSSTCEKRLYNDTKDNAP